MEHPISVSGLSPQAAKVIDPSAPPPLKMMAASGMAPLNPQELLVVLYVFSYSDDSTLGNKAKETISGMPDNVLLPSLEQVSHSGVLDGLSVLLIKKREALEKIILNSMVSDQTVEAIVRTVSLEQIIELVAVNEERMLRHPQIIEAMYLNKASRMSTVDRAVELAVRNGLELLGIPTFAEAKAAIQGQLILEPTEEPNLDDVEFQSALGDKAAEDVDVEKIDNVLEAHEENEKANEEDEKIVETLQSSLTGLPISQKIRIAMLGKSSQRAILIRDSNKLVIMAVLKSPSVSESEIMTYSKARSLPEEAVRYIAGKREWTKHYQVKLNLVNNPRTSTQEALRFLNHLRPADIRSLERSRDVPRVITNAAKELRKKRSR